MLHVLGPIVAHELDDLEELPEVQVLLIRDDIQILVEVIGLFAVKRGGQVARGI